jgi:hypothetical protein
MTLFLPAFSGFFPTLGTFPVKTPKVRDIRQPFEESREGTAGPYPERRRRCILPDNWSVHVIRAMMKKVIILEF